MYAEIFARVEKIIEVSRGFMPRYAAMEIVLSQEAPSFYLNDTSAVLFYYNALKKKRANAKSK